MDRGLECGSLLPLSLKPAGDTRDDAKVRTRLQ